ncbi:MAG TPA: hypothetical protein VIG48_03765 [Jatrophihabitans sp.]|jgi:hypothetical protein
MLHLVGAAVFGCDRSVMDGRLPLGADTGSLDVTPTGSTGSVGGRQVLPTGPLPAGAPSTDAHRP